ncbi:hypothetical protein [Metabacillus sp. FJAT-53654]|uniref:Uncharacterized protein n=1 Tax=Metabacillus rhizosphaerae TaxID=3117747 RepID=A0ABZ2N219_9BACI
MPNIMISYFGYISCELQKVLKKLGELDTKEYERHLTKEQIESVCEKINTKKPVTYTQLEASKKECLIKWGS